MKLVFLLVAFVAATARAESPSDYAFGVPITPAPGATFQRVAVPASAYEGTSRRDLTDLRVFNGDGEVVPFAFVPPPAPLRERPPAVSLPMFPLYVDRDRRNLDGVALTVVRNAAGTTISVNTSDGEAAPDRVLAGYVLDASAQAEPLAALTFAMPDTPGVTTLRMRIDASDDLANWRTVATNATLVDLAYGGQRLTKDRVEFTPTKAKYLRLSWPVGSPTMDFKSIAAEFGERPIEAKREWRTVPGTKVADREGDYEYDLGGAFPIDRIGIELATPNSIVPASVFARNAPTEQWQPAGSSVFYRIAQSAGPGSAAPPQGATDITSPPISVDGAGRRYWLLRIDPRSGIGGATAPPMRVGWQPREIVFAARGPGPFTLAFGKYDATPGALPIATLVPDYDNARGLSSNFVVGQVGERVALGGPDRLQKPPEIKRWALWGALALGALVLGWMAWRLSKDMSAAPKADEHSAESTTIVKRDG